MKIAKSIIYNVLVVVATVLISAPNTEAVMPISQQLNLQSLKQSSSLNEILKIRGGARKKSRTGSLNKSTKTVTGKKKVGAKLQDKKKDSTGDLMRKYKDILPLTRIYITMIGVCSLLGLVLGDENTQALLALDPMRVLYGMEFWRLFTSASFLGKPSVGWLMSGYYLFEYGSALERAYGPAQHLIFLFSQIGFLAVLSAVCGQPFFANSMITSMLHVLSRSMPNQKVKWLIFTVPYWSLPYGLMITDVLQAQSAAAAMPHILGILSGHFYHFHRFVWPKTGGEDWLTAPDFLIERMDPNSAKKAESKASLNKALKSRKRGKGKKLGSK
jgi:membrane associated rhomboid family serine protease